MDKYEKLLELAVKASEEQELPDNILEKIKKVCADKKADVAALTEMLVDYEPFADVGCGNESFSTKDIEKAVDRLHG